MNLLRNIACCLLLLAGTCCQARQAATLLQQGWQSLVRDDDTAALRSFADAYIAARQQGDKAGAAQALLYLGICRYGPSPAEGLEYAYRALEEYRQLEASRPLPALEGKSRCLQLIATIQARQGRYREAMTLSREALKGFLPGRDTTGYTGLIYSSLGNDYENLGLADSSASYYRLALAEHLRSYNTTYLPAALIRVAALELARHDRQASLALYNRALHLADSTGNRQARVLALLGLGAWTHAFTRDREGTLGYYRQAAAVATTLSDQTFALQAAGDLFRFYREAGNYEAAISYQDTMSRIREAIHARDRQQELKSLEIRFEVAEKDRQLKQARQEQTVTRRMNYLLRGGLAILILVSGGIILLLLRNRKRDRLLLQTQEALVQATEAQKQLLEQQQALQRQQLQQQIEFRESQLSALTLQMVQKNELMQELKARVESDKLLERDQQLGKLISRGLTQDQEWTDFNTYFESINRHFYTRLKQAYPAISTNDLKLCALIKLHLSIKEMAAILNISPDSVKTARYRLRKKLQLHTEDNLTEFILGL